MLTLVLLDVGLRVIDDRAGRDSDFYVPRPDAQPMFVPHPFMGYALRPGFERPGNKQGKYQIRVNSLGMRGQDMSIEKPAGTYRILCDGGSTVFSTGASRDENAWPAVLETILNEGAKAGPRYEVGNCGVPGWCTTESLINLELNLVDLSPDAIVLYHGANDARPIQAEGFRSDYSHLRRSWVQIELSPVDRYLLEHWRTYAWLTRGSHADQQLGALHNYVFVPGYRDLHVRSDLRVNEAGVEVFLRNLRHMVGVARMHGIQPILCTFATCRSKEKPGDERFFETVDAMNRRIREWTRAEHLPLLDVASALDERAELFDDWMHTNDAGCRRLAEVIYEAARAQGLFELR